MHRCLYRAATHALLPLALARQAWRDRAQRARLRRLGERLGGGAGTPPGAMWVHAVSVGEVNAAGPLVTALRAQDPHLRLLVTTVTATGAQRAATVFGADAEHRYLPYDTPWAVRGFLDRHRPRACIVLETELWPELFAACAARDIPVALVNARLSERSARRYARIGRLIGDALGRVSAVGAQTDADARRLVALGAPAAVVQVTGSLKFDIPAPDGALAAALRAQCAGRPVWMAASTHEGEEGAVLDAHAAVRRTRPDALLLLAPRHPPRFDAVARQCRRAGFVPARRSAGDAPGSAGVYLIDTLGELAALYGAADAAFVGGSWIPVGGHNLIEPAAAGVPCLFGPHMHNFVQLRDWVVEAGAGFAVDNPTALAQALNDLWDDPARARAMGAAGLDLVRTHRGAAARTAALVTALARP